MLPPGLAGEVPKTGASQSSAPPPPPPPPPLGPLMDKSCMDVDCGKGRSVCGEEGGYVEEKEGEFACLLSRRPPWLAIVAARRDFCCDSGFFTCACGESVDGRVIK